MTDHSILWNYSNLPAGKDDSLVARVLRGLFVELPETVRRALRARDICRDLFLVDGARLAAIGLKRANIARYAAERAGVLAGDRK